jgi:hypothetical protein
MLTGPKEEDEEKIKRWTEQRTGLILTLMEITFTKSQHFH